MLKKVVTELLKIIIAGFVSICLLSVFICFFSFSGIHITNSTGATDYTWEPNQRKAQITEGFSWLYMDENGFNNMIQLDSKIDNLVMGSSHMEAVNIAGDENVAYLLNQYIPDEYTYNIGMSGHTIYTCVQNMEAAVLEYAPSDYIILETDTVELSADKMTEVLSNSYPEIPSYDSGILYLLQKKVPLIKNIYRALGDWRNSDIKASGDNNKQGAIEIADNENDEYTEILNSFLAKVYGDAISSGAQLMIVYHPLTEIDQHGDMINTTDENALNEFEKACKDIGIIFVDMTSDFEELYEEKHILAHGFINTAVGDGHLNKYGHKAIAERLTTIIRVY